MPSLKKTPLLKTDKFFLSIFKYLFLELIEPYLKIDCFKLSNHFSNCAILTEYSFFYNFLSLEQHVFQKFLHPLRMPC